MLAANLFFVIALFGVWRTYNAWRRPDPTKPPYRRPMWLPAMVASELAPLRLVFYSALTALFLWGGIWRHRIGRIGLALMAVTLIGAIALIIRAAVSARAVSSASRPWPAAQPSPPRSMARALLGYPFRVPSSVERIEDVEYHAGCQLDIYRCGAGDSGRPVIIQVHGGGWGGGNRRQQARPLLHGMARAGWLAMSVSYPLAPDATFPDPLIAVKRAIAWVREHATRYGGDPGFIAVTGGSAGGHLASLAALTPNRSDLQPGFESADTSVDACVSFYGIYDFVNRNQTRDDWPTIPKRVMKATPEEAPEAYRLASPLDQVNEHAPPFLVIHGTHDSLVPIAEADQFFTALRERSRSRVEFLRVDGANHSFDVIPSWRTQAVVGAVHRFLESVRARRREATPD